MEAKKLQNSSFESILFEIPIDKYEKNLESDSAKVKKNEILDLLKNYNKLHSEKEFKEVEYFLYGAISSGDLDLIKIYLSETIYDDSNTFQFKIDKTNRTASLIKVNNDIQEAVIPRTVKHESVEYLITSICGVNINPSNKIQILKFVEDSAVKTIYGYVFTLTKIKEIHFPKSLKELKKKWNHGLRNSSCKITISPMNDQFKMIENKYLIDKSDPNNNEFDIFLFANHDIEEVSIPSNIKIIEISAFKFCGNLRKVDFQTNSNLQIIEESAFAGTNIEEISIPASVTKICSYAFQNCENLTKIEIPENSNLNIIESNAFQNSMIEEIYFPTNLKELGKNWCYYTENLVKITVSPKNDQFMMIENKYLLGKSDPNNNEFDVLLFVNRDIEEISIPSNIKIIATCAFHLCKKLRKVDFQTNSNLQIIEESAFAETNIMEISIPSNVKIISYDAFHNCQNLREVDFQTNSNLQIIENDAFSGSNIVKISIPASVTKICSYAFSFCINLTKVEIPKNSNLNTIELNAFLCTKIKGFFIPSKLSKISENPFNSCSSLQIIEISEKAQLESFPLSDNTFNPELVIMIPASSDKLIQNLKKAGQIK